MKTLLKQIAGIPLGMIFFLAMLPTVIVHRIVVVLKLPVSVDKLIIRVYAILEAMTDNAWFPTPSPTLASVKTLVDDLKDAQLIAKTRAAGAASARNVKKYIVLDAVFALVAYVQGICVANPESASAIAESALMYAKKISGRVKYVFSAINLTSGSIELSGSVRYPRCTHEWQISHDPFDPASWYQTLLPSTTQAKTVVTGLKPGDTVYFRHRLLTKDGYSDWDEMISIIVT